jgi:hypothetical protein
VPCITRIADKEDIMKSDFPYLMEQVALLLLGQPNKTLSTKTELRYGNKGSLAIDLRKGTFYDWENKEGGGVLDLIKRRTNCIDPIAWLHHEKLLSTAQVIPLKPRQQIEKRDTTPYARHIWQQSQPAIGTLVETYLRSRAITIPPPLSLKFHPSLEYRKNSTFWPCMVAVVSNAQGFLGIHRTYLARDGNGKAPVQEPKLALGKVQGGAVRLGPVAEKIYLAEGIETALSVMQVMGGSVWATIGTSGMLSLELPQKSGKSPFAPMVMQRVNAPPMRLAGDLSIKAGP